MSEFDSAFLCGLLRKYHPQKIVEVGVSAGGTTAIMLQCLEDIGQQYSMKSIEISNKFYLDPSKDAGFLAEPIKKSLKIGEHQFYFGTTLPFVIDEIGNNIDFVILDTMHTLPGELLDFLTILPYLKDNAVVVLHDVSLNQRHGSQFFNLHATTLLFSTVTANKILNLILNNNIQFQYPNIAAFQINSDTMKYIENVFLALILRWIYFPSVKDLKGYAEIISRHYPQKLFLIFQEALRMNYEHFIIATKSKG